MPYFNIYDSIEEIKKNKEIFLKNFYNKAL